MELTARRLLGDAADRVELSSAGTHGYLGHEMDETMATQLARTGTDSSGFRSPALTRDLLAGADLVLTAEAGHRTFVLDEHLAMFRTVLTLGQLADAVQRGAIWPGLSRAELLRAVSESRRSSNPELDVSDPFRRGPEAAERCATQIDGLLRVVLPVLSTVSKPA